MVACSRAYNKRRDLSTFYARLLLFLTTLLTDLQLIQKCKLISDVAFAIRLAGRRGSSRISLVVEFRKTVFQAGKIMEYGKCN